MSASRWLSLGLTGLIAAAGAPALADPDAIATLRGGPIAEEPAPPRLGDPRNDDRRLARNYPEQPPTIPHKVRDYQVDLNANRCLNCHSRRGVEESQAPMVSVTHFTDRDGQVRGFMSPRRYFCMQCHVPQMDARELVENDFVDVADLVKPGGGDR